MKHLEFYTDINDIYDIDIKNLKNAIKTLNLKGNLVLIAESPHAVLVLFFENDNEVQFFSYSDISGPSRVFTARNLDSAISKASCLSMFSDTLSLQKATPALDGRIPIDKKKHGIDFSLERLPKENNRGER